MAEASFTDRVKDAIASGSSAIVGALIAEAEKTAAQAAKDADAAKVTALDPLLSEQEVAAARKQMEDASFLRDRMSTAALTLRSKAVEFEKAEQAALVRQVVEDANAKVEAAAKRLREYPALANAIGKILEQVAEAGQAAANASHVSGGFVPDAEYIARGKPPRHIPLSPITSIVLPALDPHLPPIWGYATDRILSLKSFNQEPTFAHVVLVAGEKRSSATIIQTPSAPAPSFGAEGSEGPVPGSGSSHRLLMNDEQGEAA